MRKFILVDHSLRDTGGHHYPYAASVLQAAEAAGFLPTLATHRDFRSTTGFPAHWPLHALFPDVSYSSHALDTQNTEPPLSGALTRIAAPWQSVWRQWQRRRHIARFAAACDELFRRLAPGEGDIVFFPTASELDLRGLGRYLAQAPQTRAAHWHAQLHFGIHRERDWRAGGESAAASAMQASLRQSLMQCRASDLRLWCTTEPLADQYRALGVADFEVLPYPVHPFFSAFRRMRLRPRPARIACLGHARREKNQRALPALLQELWQDAFAPGRAQLVVQNARPGVQDALRAVANRLIAETPTAPGADPLDCSAGKLDEADYARLVCGSDIGLLLYDPRRYHDRCSGVLLEMLVAGVPVVVPARSWLSEQIAAANQAWLQQSADALLASGRLRRLTEAEGKVAQPPDDCSGVLLACEIPGSAEAGVAIEVSTTAMPGGESTNRTVWLEAARGSRRALRLLPVPAGCPGIMVRSALPVTVDAISGPLPPLGAIGLAIQDTGEAAQALRDILQHIEHYKALAAQHAVQRAEECSSARIIERLVGRA